MRGPTYRLKMKSSWRGKLDSTDPNSPEVEVKKGEEADVDAKTFQALVFQYDKAEPASVEEIEAKAKTKATAGKGTAAKDRASKTKKS